MEEMTMIVMYTQVVGGNNDGRDRRSNKRLCQGVGMERGERERKETAPPLDDEQCVFSWVLVSKKCTLGHVNFAQGLLCYYRALPLQCVTIKWLIKCGSKTQ